jgi:hypothetical protein
VKAHPASRVLLFYAACLALMMVAALSIAALRNAPAAQAGSDVPDTTRPIEARAR